MRRTKYFHFLFYGSVALTPLTGQAQPLHSNPVEDIPSEQPPNKANAHFLAGVAAMKEDTPEGYEIALREFRAAYKDFPSWKILGNWGIAAHRLERHGEALPLFEKYLEEGGNEIDAEERRAVLADIASIQRELATLRIVPPKEWSTYWVIDHRFSTERGTINRYGPFRGSTTLSVGFGNRQVVLEREDKERTDMWNVLVMPGDSAEHQYESAAHPNAKTDIPPSLRGEELPPVDTGGWKSSAAYASWGVGLISGGVAVAALLHANSLQQESNREFEASCPDGPQMGDPACPTTISSDRTAANWRTVALVGGVLAGTGLALGTWFYVTDDGLALEASVDFQSIRIRGAF